MTILFHKTGTRLTPPWLFGPGYRFEYVFSTLKKLPIATLTHVDFNAAIIKFNDAVFNIAPDTKSWTYKYLIHEGDQLLGLIKIDRLNRQTIELSTGKVFKLTRSYKSFWERISNKVYRFKLQCDDAQVFYEFVKEVGFERGFTGAYTELRGTIESDFEHLPVSFFGIILIEQLLKSENDN